VTRLRFALGSYRARLVLGYVLVVLLLAAVWAVSLFGPLDSAVRDQQRNAMTIVARGVANSIATMPGITESEARRLVTGTDWRLTIVDADGEVLADTSTDPSRMENHADRQEVAAALAGREGSAERRSRTTGVPQLYVAVPGKLAGSPVAVRVSEPVRALGDLAGETRALSLVALVVALALAAIVAWRLSASATRPISELADAAHRMATGDLSGAVPEAPGELGELSSALTDLRDQMHLRVDGLETERRNLRAVLDGLADGMFLLEDGRVALANDGATKLFDAPFGGWRGRELDDRVLPASLAAAVAGLASAGSASEGGARSGQSRDVGPDPKGRWYRVTVLPLLGASGTAAARTLVTIADTTDRMRLDRMRTDFVANASHELKTPTAGILLLAESARSAAGDGDTQMAMGFLGQIETEADRLRRLVADLLDLSRLEYAPEPGSITDVRRGVDLSLSSHKAAARLKGLELRMDLGAVADQDVFVRADPTDVAVALDNILDNAVTYTDAGSVQVRVSATPGTVRIAVSDTGVGIPTDDLPRVFERFYRVDRSRVRLTGGTGLGLSLVRHVVERSGGSVDISSELGTGTTVTITFPRA
jgi:two-component system phosphate regulon sensor histidine kinase PhoR